jgi:hypothetical protein
LIVSVSVASGVPECGAVVVTDEGARVVEGVDPPPHPVTINVQAATAAIRPNVVTCGGPFLRR